MQSMLWTLLTSLIVTSLMAGCGTVRQDTVVPTQAGLPNPASVFCEGHGGRLEIRADAAGNQAGFCIFPDGSECDEWAFFRGECGPGGTVQSATPTGVPVVELTATPPEGWETYTHPTLGYSFQYPVGSVIETEDVGRFISIVGPLRNNAHWPAFNVAHPDLEDYHPPASADLRTWLEERQRLVGKVVGTRVLAGTTAIHTRNDYGPQACDDDRFYFLHAGQIYEITIVHTAAENWTVYDQFLDSFHF